MNLPLKYMKSYKKNAITIFLSFLLTLGLMTALLILTHSNHKLQAIEKQMYVSPADVRITGLSRKQVNKLKVNSSVYRLAVTQPVDAYTRGDQTIFYCRGDAYGITMTSRLLEGNLPVNGKEIAAEKWVLMNLGIQPEVGQRIDVLNSSGQKKTVTLVGILADMPKSKQVGTLSFYSVLRPTGMSNYIVSVTFKNGKHLDSQIRNLADTIGISGDQIEKSPGRENMQELAKMDVELMAVLFLICFVVFYGIFRISMAHRQDQYGILRAIGMKRRKISRLILTELYLLYLPAIPLGVALGVASTAVIFMISGDRRLVIYFYNQKIPMNLTVPAVQIGVAAAGLGIMIAIVGYLTSVRINRQSVMEIISDRKMKPVRFVPIRSASLIKVQHLLGLKYIFCDKRTSVFVVLTITLGISLFYGLYSQAWYAASDYRETKDMTYLNGEYAMGVLSFGSALEGMDRESVAEIKELPQVSEVETSSGLPVRVVHDKSIETNRKYYEAYESGRTKLNGFQMSGYDGTDEIYPTIFYGYSDSALRNLQNYVIAGNIRPSGLKADEVIVSVMSKSDRSSVGYYKVGEPLMNYKVGDTITLKYRTDLDTNSIEYQSLTDRSSQYQYKRYKVAAVTSFPYMQDLGYSVYPLLMTSDKWLKQMVPESRIQCMYVNGVKHTTGVNQQSLENRLIQIGIKNGSISARSLIPDRMRNRMLFQKQMVYVFGIAGIALILMLFNIVNNLKYRIETRKQEISIFRSIGMKFRTVRGMILFENLYFVIVSMFFSLPVSYFAGGYMFGQTDLKDFNYQYHFDLRVFLLIALLTALICIGISYFLSNAYRTENIMEQVES